MNRPTPYSEGDPSKSKIVFVGEAPSHSEMAVNRPFVGPAGRVFDRCLQQAGIARTECYITNVFSNPIKKHGVAAPKDLFEVEEDDYFRLVDVFKKIREDAIVVPLGATALRFLCDVKEIMKWRGSVTPCTFEKFQHTIIPTIHPAATLRGQFLWTYFIVSDLKKIKRWSEGKGKLPQRTYYLKPTVQEVMDYLDHILTLDQYAMDIEVWNNQVSCISFASSPNNAMSIPFVDLAGMSPYTKDKSYFPPNMEMRVWRKIAEVIGSGIPIIGQNLMFDLFWLYHFEGIVPIGDIKDTYLAHHIMYPDFPAGLDFLCSVYTDEPYYKEDRKMWKNFKVDQMKFWEYNAKDSAATYEVWNAIEPDLGDYQRTYDMTTDIFYPLLYAAERGLSVDRDRLATTRVEIESRLAELTSKLDSVAEHPFNPASPKQCMQYFYVTKGIRPYVSRTTGKASCDDKALQRLATTHGLEEAKIVQEIRRLAKLQGTYLSVELDSDSMLRTSYNPRGTVNGRISSSKTLWGNGLNLQNLHPAFKDFIVARKL